ncbi:MAG: SDR family oxidoreductase [Ignavibacteriae bacterium]|nr:SDR family oxidoreductase [Ignavibacteriota bacterium]
MNDVNVLIIGSSGRIASSLIKFFNLETNNRLILLSNFPEKLPHYEGYSYHKVNALDFKEIKNICFEERPEVIINASGYTDVDKCETERNISWDLNVTLAENLASISRVLDSHLISFSSDYVFDGSKGPYCEDDRQNPINFYGRTKHGMENACLYNLNMSTVIRTNCVYGSETKGKTDFIRWILYKLEQGYGFEIVDGQYCNPTFTEDIAVVVNKVITKKRYGIYHTGGPDWLSRYDIALNTARIFSLDETLIKPISANKLSQRARRPNKGGLVTLKSITDLGIKFTSLESGLMTLRQSMRDSRFTFVMKGN